MVPSPLAGAAVPPVPAAALPALAATLPAPPLAVGSFATCPAAAVGPVPACAAVVGVGAPASPVRGVAGMLLLAPACMDMVVGMVVGMVVDVVGNEALGAELTGPFAISGAEA